MTNTMGRCFVSYRRSRLSEVQALVERLHDLGVPTWLDIHNLDEEPTEQAIRSVLSDPNTANAIIWLTPEVESSSMIRRVEAPLILERHSRADGFFVVPVAAGGLDYDKAASVVEGDIGTQNLKQWNIRRLSSAPASEADVQEVAGRVMRRRLDTIHEGLPLEERLRVTLNTRTGYQPDYETALLIDWTHRFDDRLATDEIWRDHLLPALSKISAQVKIAAPGREILASGLLSIPAATALGYSFMAPQRIALIWEQYMPDGSIQEWSLLDLPEDSGFQVNMRPGDVDADDLAVLISVNADVTAAVADSREYLPSFRAYVHIAPPDGASGAVLSSSGQAVDVARSAILEVRRAREEYGIRGKVHLFMAIPVGLAMLIGQLLNTLGQVQTYEHIPQGATGHYTAAALLGEQ